MNYKSLSPLLLVLLAACATQAPVEEAPKAPPPVVAAPAKSLVELVLAYHHTLRAESPSDLGKELLALNNAPPGAMTEVRKAMVLELMRDSAKLTRSRVLLRNVLMMKSQEALVLRPLVEWMMTNNSEFRRANSLAERQAQQLKDAQRRYDALNEKLEAMKRIETSQPASPIEITPATPAK
jgi:hypothetical protein